MVEIKSYSPLKGTVQFSDSFRSMVIAIMNLAIKCDNNSSLFRLLVKEKDKPTDCFICESDTLVVIGYDTDTLIASYDSSNIGEVGLFDMDVAASSEYQCIVSDNHILDITIDQSSTIDRIMRNIARDDRRIRTVTTVRIKLDE